MRRLGLLLTIVGLGVGAAVTLSWLRTDTAVPMVPLVPATPVEAAAVPAVGTTSPATPVVDAPNAGGDAAERVPLETPVAVLLVELRRPNPADAPTASAGEPIADVDLEVSLDGAAPQERLLGVTDARGQARFEVPGGDGLWATVRCPLAAPARVQLQAAAPVQLQLAFCLRGIVRGTVVDAAGRGIGGAELRLLPAATDEQPLPRERRAGQARSDGSFELALAVGGALGAAHPDYAPSAMWTVPVQADPTRAPTVTVLQLSLLTAPSDLHGRVLDPDGQPVAGAQLEFRSTAPAPAGAALVAPPRRSRSASDGTFAIEGLRPGRLEFAARADGRGFQRGSLELAAGAGRTLEIRLLPLCEVHGRVEDQGGSPIADARVWSGAGDDLESVATTSGADGTFRLAGLPPGPVTLVAREGTGRNAEPMARRATARLELVPGEPQRWVATLRAPRDQGYLRGQLVDADGVRLPGWRIAVRCRHGVGESPTDSGGFFRVALPGAGALDLFVHAPGAAPRSFAHSVLRGVVPGPAPMRVTIERHPAAATVVGRVQAIDRTPLAATLTCWHQQRQEQAIFRCEADGSFQIGAVPPGTIDLYVDHPGYARLLHADVVVLSDQTLDLDTLLLDRSAVLYGEVRGPGGEPPADLQVTLHTAGPPVVGEYSAGVYRFAAAPPGSHVLQVQGTAVAAANWPVTLRGGVERRQDLELLAGVPRHITVTAPIPAGTTVFLVLRTPGTAHAWQGATSLQVPADAATAERAEGRFLAYMAPGTYEAIAWTGEAWVAHASVAFVPGDDTEVTIRLLPR